MEQPQTQSQLPCEQRQVARKGERLAQGHGHPCRGSLGALWVPGATKLSVGRPWPSSSLGTGHTSLGPGLGVETDVQRWLWPHYLCGSQHTRGGTQGPTVDTRQPSHPDASAHLLAGSPSPVSLEAQWGW